MRGLAFSKTADNRGVNNSTISQLEDILDSESRLVRDLLGLEEAKTAYLLDRDAVGFAEVVREEEEKARVLEKVEGLRRSLTARVVHDMNLGEAASLREIAERLDVGRREKILALRDRLRDLAARLKDINTKNGELLRASLDVVTLTLNLVTGAESESGGYTPEGALVRRSGRSLLDASA